MPSLIFLLILSQNLGVGHRFPWSWLPLGMGRGFWGLATLFFIGALFSKNLRKTLDQLLARLLSLRAFFLTLVVLNAAYALLNYGYFRGLGYSIPVLHLILCALAGVFIWRGTNPLRVALGLSVGLLVSSIMHFPLNPTRSDMLPVIAGAFEQWKLGGSPYGVFILNGGDHNTMPYLPGVFLSHWPAWAAGVDLRWGSVLFRALWGVLLLRQSDRLPPGSLWMKMAAVWLLNPYLNFRHDLYFEFFNFLMVAFWCVRSLRGLTLALMIVSRQWAWVLAPFLIFGMVMKKAWRDLGLFVLSSVVLGGLGIALFAGSTTWTGFGSVVLSGFQERLSWSEFPGDFGFTLAPLFYALHAAPLLQYLQAALCVGFFLWVVLRRPQQAFYYGWVTLSLFLMLNMHFWNYFWISPSLFLLAGWGSQLET